MNFYCSPRFFPQLVGYLSLCGLQLVVAPVAKADNAPLPPTPTAPVATPPAGTPATTPPVEKSPPTPDAHDFLTVANTQRAFKMPLDLTVENASLKDVVARIEKVLATRKAKDAPAPPIEVRGVRPVRLTFAVKGSTVGGVLSAAARLAGARLYFFGGYALVAPANALLPDEVALTDQGLGSNWVQSDFLGNKGAMAKRRALTSFIAKDMGGISGQGGTGPSLATRSKPVKVSQLSPDAQAMLQELVSDMNTFIPQNHPSSAVARIFPFALSPDAEVSLNQTDSLVLRSPKTESQVNWELGGNGFGWGGGGGSKNSTEKPSLSQSAPPFDPSAGKS